LGKTIAKRGLCVLEKTGMVIEGKEIMEGTRQTHDCSGAALSKRRKKGKGGEEDLAQQG